MEIAIVMGRLVTRSSRLISLSSMRCRRFGTLGALS